MIKGLHSDAEYQKLVAEVARLQSLAKMGMQLSMWAAAINWDGLPNTPEYMAGLRDWIECYQAAYESELPLPSPEEPPAPTTASVPVEESAAVPAAGEDTLNQKQAPDAKGYPA